MAPSDSLWPHGLQHTRPPCPSPTPEVYSNSCPLSQWCHLTISSPVVSFSSCLQSFLVSGSFQIGQFFTSGGQRIGLSASASVLPVNSFRMDWLDVLAVQGTLKSLLQDHSSNSSILQHSAFFIVQLSHPYRTTGKTIALTRHTFVGKVMSLLFNMLFSLVITFLPRSKCLLFFFSVYLYFIYLFFLFVVNFVIHWNETATGLHVFPILIPPPTSLSTRSP